jgi:ABC-type hemin transport system ATPase subunit
MAHFDVTEFSQRNYQTLSGGERQRVNFARVLAQLWRDDSSTGRYLFLDEPLTFLDIRHQIDFMKKVRAFAVAPDVVTVGVVHDLNLAARFADHIVLLNHGRLVATGTPTDVLTPILFKRHSACRPHSSGTAPASSSSSIENRSKLKSAQCRQWFRCALMVGTNPSRGRKVTVLHALYFAVLSFA